MLVAPVQMVAVIMKKNHFLVVVMPIFFWLGFLPPDGIKKSAVAISTKPIILKAFIFSPRNIIENKIGKAMPKFTIVLLKDTAPVLNDRT